MVIIGEQSPPKSKAEMAALAEIPYVQVEYMSGSLGDTRRIYNGISESNYVSAAIKSSFM
jgi:hypothetical protein